MIPVKAVSQHIHRALVHPEHLPIPLEFQLPPRRPVPHIKSRLPIFVFRGGQPPVPR